MIKEKIIDEINLFRKEVEDQQTKDSKRFEEILNSLEEEKLKAFDGKLFDYIFNQYGEIEKIINHD